MQKVLYSQPPYVPGSMRRVHGRGGEAEAADSVK